MTGALIVVLVPRGPRRRSSSRGRRVVVPQQSAYVVERLGQVPRDARRRASTSCCRSSTSIRYRHSLKEHAVDIPEQVCITRDNVQVHVDGVLYLKVLNPERASYGVSDYLFAISQLAQTTLRSEIGKIDLDRTFEERTHINIAGGERARQGVRALGHQGAALRDQEHHAARRTCSPRWRSRCAPSARSAPSILTSEGERDAGDQQRRGREAAGHQGVGGRPSSSRSTRPRAQAAAILAVADATARGHPQGRRGDPGAGRLRGGAAARRRAVHRRSFGELAKEGNTMILPANVADVGSMIALAMNVIGRGQDELRRRGGSVGPVRGSAHGRPAPSNCLQRPRCEWEGVMGGATERYRRAGARAARERADGRFRTARGSRNLPDRGALPMRRCARAVSLRRSRWPTPIRMPTPCKLGAGCTYTFEQPDNPWYGPNALPPIASEIVVEGNGAILVRGAGPGAARLRFFYVGADAANPATQGYSSPGAGALTLRNLTLQDGRQLGGSAGGAGGGGAGMGRRDLQSGAAGRSTV